MSKQKISAFKKEYQATKVYSLFLDIPQGIS